MVRVDILLRQRFPEASRVFLQKLIRDGRVTVNGKLIQKSHQMVSPEVRVECAFPKPQKSHIEPKVGSLHIIFEDRDIIVLDKPAGISVHPSLTEKKDTIVSFLLAYCENLSGIGGVLRPGIVHRLDKDTSGLLVVAKNDLAHRTLSAQFSARTVEKEYIALVKGVLPSKRGRIEAPIGRNKHDRKKMAVTPRHGSREAFTEYEVIKNFGSVACLIRVFPKTGRTHQIRVHFASIHYPVIGDSLYGDKKLNKKFAEEFGLHRQFLHAAKLTFIHPRMKKKMCFTSKLPKDLEPVLKILKL